MQETIYEKASNTELKVISTTQSSETISLKSLKELLEAKIKERDEAMLKFSSQIKDLEKNIIEAEKLGITESAEAEDIVI